MNGIQISIQATDEQIKAMEAQCDLNEALMAETLARRVHGVKREETAKCCRSWFKTVRQMAQAAYMTSGIQVKVTPIVSPELPVPGAEPSKGP